MPRSARFDVTEPFVSSSRSTSKKKKHICNVCDRIFTTSGHLARHSRVHTGERNYSCPFPGCETRCSRQDNLQQHYRIHLSPGSRRQSTRKSSPRKRASDSSGSVSSNNSGESVNLQTSSTPPLEYSRDYASHSSSPESPALDPLPAPSAYSHSRLDSPTGRGSDSSSSSSYYSSTQGLSLPVSTEPNYNYRGASYQDETASNNFNSYVHDSLPISETSHNYTYSQSNSHYNTTYPPHQSRSSSSSPTIPSRHSISHINNPQYRSSHGPPSPSPSSAPQSGPPTPSYAVHYGNNVHAHAYTHAHNTMVVSQPAAVHHSQVQSQPDFYPSAYNQNSIITHPPRYPSPLTLAPIQDERYIRSLENNRSHNSAPYQHALIDYSSYQHSIGSEHIWRTETTMRKAVI